MNREESSFQYSSLFVFSVTCVLSFLALLFAAGTRFPSDHPPKYLPVIPSRFVVDNDFLLPPKPDSSILLSRFFAIISLFESYLKVDRVFHGKGGEVLLSEQALMNALDKECVGTNQSLCDIALDATSMVQYFLKFKAFNDSIVTEDSCRYGEICSKQDPIRFILKEPSFARSIEGIKTMIFKQKRPLLFSMPEIFADYYILCSDERVTDRQKCEAKEIICPSHVSKNGEYCHVYSSSTLFRSGHFFVPDSPAVPRVSESINFVIVGYNDDFVPPGTSNFFSSHNLPRGGFIVKGHHRDSSGHSLNFLLGKETAAYDRTKCPIDSDPNSWKPCRSPDCTMESFLDCKDSKYCDKSKSYALVSDYVKTNIPISIEDEMGLSNTLMYEITESSTEHYQKMGFTSVPFWDLGFIFSPQKLVYPGMDCGYWFIPYGLVEMALSIEEPGVANTIAVDIPIRFIS